MPEAESVLCARVAHALRVNRAAKLSAWFIRPGEGPRVKVRSSVVQQGRTLAVLRTQVVNADGRLVLDVTSQHIARKAQAVSRNP